MTIDMSQFYQVFFEETAEHLAEMESLLLELDIDRPDLEMLNAIFRAAHSIKGGAGTFGFSDMAGVTHVLETLLDRLRKQELNPTVEMIDVFLEAGDVLKAQLAAHQEGGEPYEDARIAEVCARLERLSRDEGGDRAAAPRAARLSVVVPARRVWHIELPPEAGLDAGAIDGLLAALAELGDIERLDAADDASALVCRLSGDADPDAILDILAFVCDPRLVRIRPADERAGPAADIEGDGCGLFADAPGAVGGGRTDAGPADTEGDGYGFFADAPGAVTGGGRADVGPADTEGDGYGFFADAPGAVQAVDQEREGYGLFGGSPGMERAAAVAAQDRLDDERGFGFFDPSPGYPDPAARAAPASASASARKSAAPASPPAGRQDANARRAATSDTSIRVSVEKVDQLINLVGELVITHAMLAESASGLEHIGHESIFDGLANLERNSRDLQQAVMSIRMMPISFVFNRFPRVVRDTAASLGKKVELQLVGEDTELDKGVIERLADPLNHLVRNSIDHGIESPERRAAAGKRETGTIVLKASHKGGNILVEVSDDGAGLNRDKLLAKAAERGVPVSEHPTDKEVWQLIFAAGFSTAEKVTDISGRGVGMDVVRRNIEEMNGRVEIDSVAGQGTRIVIRLPLTLAILDGMSVRMGREIFILPLTAIRESMQPRREQIKTVVGKGRMLQVGEEYLPLVALRDVFNIDSDAIDAEDGILVVVDTSEGRAALLVDELIAQHQVVIKSLETNYRKVEGASGATIMGDGRVALILDVDALVRLSQQVAASDPAAGP